VLQLPAVLRTVREAKEQKSDSRVAYRAPAQQGGHICKEVEVGSTTL
jgi:hypothetical protein